MHRDPVHRHAGEPLDPALQLRRQAAGLLSLALQRLFLFQRRGLQELALNRLLLLQRLPLRRGPVGEGLDITQPPGCDALVREPLQRGKLARRLAAAPGGSPLPDRDAGPELSLAVCHGETSFGPPT